MFNNNIDNTYRTYYAVYTVERNRVKDRDLIKKLKENGWQLDRVRGSHHVMKKEGKTEIVPVHGKDVPKGLLQKILKRTGLRIREDSVK